MFTRKLLKLKWTHESLPTTCGLIILTLTKVIPLLWQRFPNCRREFSNFASGENIRLIFPDEMDELEREEIIRLAITGKTHYKAEIEIACQKTPKFHIPNSLKTDMKERFLKNIVRSEIFFFYEIVFYFA